MRGSLRDLWIGRASSLPRVDAGLDQTRPPARHRALAAPAAFPRNATGPRPVPGSSPARRCARRPRPFARSRKGRLSGASTGRKPMSPADRHSQERTLNNQIQLDDLETDIAPCGLADPTAAIIIVIILRIVAR